MLRGASRVGTMAVALTMRTMSPENLRVGEPMQFDEPSQRKSRMVEISMYGSGEGPSWATGWGYSTVAADKPGLSRACARRNARAKPRLAAERGRSASSTT